MVRLIFFLLIILSLSSCNKSSYEKYAECVSINKNKLKSHEQMCFKQYSKTFNDNASLNGTGSVLLPNFGEYRTYKFFNKTDNIIAVNNVSLYIDDVSANTMGKTRSQTVILECEYKKIFPRKKTRIKCFNYNNSDQLENYIKMSKQEENTIKKHWSINSASSISPTDNIF